jgi:hypothetical protein
MVIGTRLRRHCDKCRAVAPVHPWVGRLLLWSMVARYAIFGDFGNVRNAFDTHDTIRLVRNAVWVRELCHVIIFKPSTASDCYVRTTWTTCTI